MRHTVKSLEQHVADTRTTPGDLIRKHIEEARKKAEPARLLREELLRVKAERKEFIRNSVGLHGLKFMHFRRSVVCTKHHGLETHPMGGATVAYAQLKRGDRRIVIAAVTCSDKELYNRVEGAYQAAKAFRSGNVIPLSVPKKMTPDSLVCRMFSVFTRED